MGSGFLEFLKNSFGWVYFLSWSLTFWPQVILNYRRGCTNGLSPNFIVMSSTGFVAYAIFTFYGFFSASARAEYALQRGAPPPIELNDVFFAAHATILSTTLIVQVLLLPPGLRARRDVVVVCMAIVSAIAISLTLSNLGKISWVFTLEMCGAIKVLTSIVKHFPQAWSNFKRKSTVGWSFTMICLDIVGGGFSLAQQAVRCLIEQSWRPYTQNLSKLFLAAESILFDLFFVVQHVCLYPNREDPDALYQRLPDQAPDAATTKK